MTIRPMYKKCKYCHRIYSYNPSLGHLGHMCPYCKNRPLTQKVEIPKIIFKKKGSDII